MCKASGLLSECNLFTFQNSFSPEPESLNRALECYSAPVRVWEWQAICVAAETEKQSWIPSVWPTDAVMPPSAPITKTLAWVLINVQAEKTVIAQMIRTSTMKKQNRHQHLVSRVVIRLLLESKVSGLNSLPHHDRKDCFWNVCLFWLDTETQVHFPRTSSSLVRIYVSIFILWAPKCLSIDSSVKKKN